MAIRLNSAEHLRVEAEDLDRDELICNLVTVQMGRDALQDQIEKLKAGTLLKFQEVEIEELTEENEKLKEENEGLIHPNDVAKLFGQESFQFYSWNEMVMNVVEENKKLKEDKKRLSIYLAEIGEDCDCRDEGARATEFKYAEWFNKITNNEFL
tara:strand:- start:120 stop:581 length:462 start_codon:yes stop_codon:yes gene_type:complete